MKRSILFNFRIPFSFKKTLITCLCCVLFIMTAHISLAFSPREDLLHYTSPSEMKELVNDSTLIALGHLKPTVKKWQLGEFTDQYHIINTLQFFRIEQAWKGKPLTMVQVFSSGLTPLPPAHSSLKNTFPGELAEGNYLLFLKPIPNTPYFQLTAGMQSVYPIKKGRLLSLIGGFPELDGVSIKALPSILSTP